MESAQRELLCVLLRRLYELGLIDQSTCMGAQDAVQSGLVLPALFRDSMGLTEEENGVECAENTQ